MGALVLCAKVGRKKVLSLLMMYDKSNKRTHFRTETRIERKTQSYSGYTHTQRGVESEKGGFWFASKKLTNISVEYNNFIVH